MGNLGVGGHQAPHTGKHRLPDSLKDLYKGEKTWISEGWTNLPNGVQPFQKEQESEIVCSLISELNGLFNLDLCKEPGFDRLTDSEPVAAKPRILMIGASHVVREAEILADRGYEVTLVSKPGWRATKGSVPPPPQDRNPRDTDHPPPELFLNSRELRCQVGDVPSHPMQCEMACRGQHNHGPRREVPPLCDVQPDTHNLIQPPILHPNDFEAFPIAARQDSRKVLVR
jgi:hypothetical protein